jgi:putative ABC transport system permease protein
MPTLFRDLRHAVRSLRRQPGFTLVALLTLALGIGANTAVFSVMYGVLLRPLPLPDAGSLVSFTEPGGDGSVIETSVNWPEYQVVEQYLSPAMNLAVETAVGFNVSNGEATVRAGGLRVTHTYFDVLGIRPALGRTFTAEEDQPGGPNTVVLSHGLWQRQFAADAGIIGRSILIDGAPFVVIGVMPADYRPVYETEAWSTIGQVSRTIGSGQNLGLIGRLKAGVSFSAAEERIPMLQRALGDQFGRFAPGRNVIGIASFRAMAVQNVSLPLRVVTGAIALVLLIACANVASLVLSRGAARNRELAVRTALGASRGNLVRLLMIESVVLALAGGALGFLVSVWGLQGLHALLPPNLPQADAIQLDWIALAFTLALSLLTGVLVGLIPAWQLTRSALHDTIRQGSSRITAPANKLRNALVVGEVAIAMVLLVGAGLLIQAFTRLMKTDPGFDPKGVVSAEIWLTGTRYTSTEAVANFYRDLTGRLKTLPGVTGAAVVEAGQPLRRGGNMPFDMEGVQDRNAVGYRTVTPDYLPMLGVPLKQGRMLEETDTESGEQVVLVNEAFVRRYSSDREPLGRMMKIGGDNAAPRRIVGVVGDLRSFVGFPAEPTVFYASRQTPIGLTSAFSSWFPIHVMVRTSGSTATLPDAIVKAIQEVDPMVPVGQVRPMSEVLSQSLAMQQFVMRLLGLFATLAGVLAAIGIYGVISYLVIQRTQELGVRMALGARPADLLGMVLGRGLRLTFMGVGIGLAGAIAFTRVLRSQLYGVSTTDPVTLSVVSLLFATVALLACLIPARRATRVDPMVAMRGD